MYSRKSSNQVGYSMKDRILARILVLIMTVSMMPYQSLAAYAAETKRVKSIEDIRTEYEVDHGTSQDEIGLPSSLSVVIETTRSSAGKTDAEPERTEETVQEDIVWEGDYDGDYAGTYELEARFENKDLVYEDEDMPVVYVTVREPENNTEEDDQAEQITTTEEEKTP
ncbi:MAG: hypothetical protein IJJ25_13330 [Lachnospiraceae bacterium]|nr:hypothetical protein [Lachnospiraceae bacterium]